MTDVLAFDVPLRAFEGAAELFGLLATPSRLRIVSALCGGEKNVTELLALINVTQPNMSQHLRVLYRSGLVARRRSGVQMYYRIAGEVVELVCQVVCAQLSADGEQGCALTRVRHGTGGTGL